MKSNERASSFFWCLNNWRLQINLVKLFAVLEIIPLDWYEVRWIKLKCFFETFLKHDNLSWCFQIIQYLSIAYRVRVPSTEYRDDRQWCVKCVKQRDKQSVCSKYPALLCDITWNLLKDKRPKYRFKWIQFKLKTFLLWVPFYVCNLEPQ